MKLLILAAVLALSSAAIQKTIVIINNINYEQETFIQFPETYFQMISISIDHKNNDLYYTYLDSTKMDEISASVNLETKESYNMTGEGTIVDQKTHRTYMKKFDGIYEFNRLTRSVRDLVKTDLLIYKIFAKDLIYFTTTLDETAYVYKNGNIEKVAEIGKAELIAVDRDDNIYFTNWSGLFFHKKGGEKTTFVDKWNNVYAFCMDLNNEQLYFTTDDGIYSTQVTNGNVTLTKLTNDCCTRIKEMAIASDGSFFYTELEGNAIIRLKPIASHL